jgi:putative aldouronate transport system permease protein
MNKRIGGSSALGIGFDLANMLFLLLLVLTMIIPLLNALALSFSTGLDSMVPHPVLWPKAFSIEGYTTVWTKIKLWRPFWNNTIVTVFGTLGHVIHSSLAGYVLIQRELPGKRLLMTFILFTMAIPGEVIMIPLYMVYKDLSLLNSLNALILSGFVSGFSILLMRNYFLSVPYEMAESARIDGAGEWRIFITLFLPLASAGLATVTLFEFVSRWNQYTAAVLYLNDTSKYTLQIALRSLIIDTSATSSSFIITNNVRMAGVVIGLIPLIAIYPFVQKFFVKGMMIGSVKE